jgi:hypothetical protein
MRLAAVLLFPLLIVPLVSAQVPMVTLKQPKSDWDTGYFRNATVGDFASYNNLKGELLRRPEVVELGDRQVTVDVTGLAGGKPTIQSRQILVFSGEWSASNQGKPTVSVVKVKVGDRELTCELSEYRNPDGKLTRRNWKCPQVPFGGLVKDEGYKVDADGTEVLTGGQILTDFKFAKAPK